MKNKYRTYISDAAIVQHIPSLQWGWTMHSCPRLSEDKRTDNIKEANDERREYTVFKNFLKQDKNIE